MNRYPATVDEPRDQRLKTATELEAEAQEKTRIARLYETLLREVAASEKAVEYYRRVTSEPDKDLRALEAIASVLDDISETHVTRGSQFLPGGFELKTVFRIEIGAALSKVKRARTAIEAKLPEVETRLVESKEALARFEKNYATTVA